jgi:Cof subfamily protein (haloacid dehalogenase superfamily)
MTVIAFPGHAGRVWPLARWRSLTRIGAAGDRSFAGAHSLASVEDASVSPAPIRLLLADVDGTLVTNDKELTARAVEAVHQLDDAGILFAVTSGRPPRGMAMLIGPLDIKTPLAAFNGGLVVEPDMSVIDQKVIPGELVQPIVAMLESSGLDVWIYQGAAWYVRDVEAPHVAREAFTVQFEPTVLDSYEGVSESVAKIVGVSDDHDLVAAVAGAAHDKFGDHVSAARSQPYYLDVTHPQANKGGVVKYLSARYGISPEEIATIGDMPNDVLMFAHSGLSIAMGQSDREVHRAARRITTSNEEDGFAHAVERFILRRDDESMN